MWFRRRRASSKSAEEAKEALLEAQEALRTVQERGDEVTAISQESRDIRDRNHFADQLEEILRRRRPLHDS